MIALYRLAAPLCCIALAACNTLTRLEEIGKPPELCPIDNPVAQPNPMPVSLPMPDPEPLQSAGANSLWRSGAKGFFRDQRARRVGDILTVQVSMSDNASWSNQTTRSRQADDHLGIPRLLRPRRTSRCKALPDAIDGTSVDPGDFVKMDSQSRTAAAVRCNRAEEIRMNVAAVVTQTLPNGNLVIQGRQEVRVNFEMREVIVAGIVRPEDITPKNTIAPREDRRAARRLWRPRPDHRRAAAALRRPGARHPAALLRRAASGAAVEPARPDRRSGVHGSAQACQRSSEPSGLADLHHVLDPAVEEGPALGAAVATGRRASRARCATSTPASVARRE